MFIQIHYRYGTGTGSWRIRLVNMIIEPELPVRLYLMIWLLGGTA